MNQTDKKQLLKKYLDGQCTAEENAVVESWYLELSKKRTSLSQVEVEEAEEDMWDNLQKQIKPRIFIGMWFGIAAAALVLITIGAGLFYYTNKPSAIQSIAYTKNIKPGINKATLTLGDGRKVVLSETTNGKLAEESGVSITQTLDGQLIYAIRENADNRSEISYNTLTTANGEQYQVRLPDGTNVWVNSASKLTYPSSFTHTDHRKVELIGEAYFEVAKDKKHPFIVKSGNQEVEVLGTSFNVNTFADKVQTTLVEGKVNIKAANKQLTLMPGQQANFEKSTGGLEKLDVDVYPYVAWKEGVIAFQSMELSELMEQIGRLYDYEIIFEEESLKQLHCTGRADRSDSLNTILDLIQETSNLKFTIQGRQIIVEKSTKK